MRPHHIKSPVQYTGLRVGLPAGAVAPALHRLAVLSNHCLPSRRPPSFGSHLPLRDVLCCQSSRSSSELNPWHQSADIPACGRNVQQQLVALGLSLVMTLSPALCAFNPATAQQLPVMDCAAATLARSAGNPDAEVSVQLEESLMQALRQIEATIDSVVTVLSNSIPGFVTASSAAGAQPDVEAESAVNLVQEVYELVADNYLDARSGGFDPQRWEQLKDQALQQPLRDSPAAYRAIREMLAKGTSDPYTRFITPEEFESMRKYDVTGVGLHLGTAEEFVRKTGLRLPPGHDESEEGIWVVGMILGSPAQTAGVEQGDQLLGIDEMQVDGQSPFQAASAISGGDAEPESILEPTVRLQVRKRNGSETALAVNRPVKKIMSPVEAYLDDRGSRKVGVIKLSGFNARAQQDVAQAVKALTKQGASEFTLDVRDNRGGLYQEGAEVAKLFLEDGATVVVTEGRGHVRNKPLLAHGPALTRAPLTVLINQQSASASEIFAGAVRDNCRAILVGKRTFGKGLIQSVYELSDGSGMVITNGKYLTPALTDIDREGIAPDFKQQPSPEAAASRLNACLVPTKASM
ncbi:hypothetical protein WJX82_005349 [Trebouxia sp. C0006]